MVNSAKPGPHCAPHAAAARAQRLNKLTSRTWLVVQGAAWPAGAGRPAAAPGSACPAGWSWPAGELHTCMQAWASSSLFM